MLLDYWSPDATENYLLSRTQRNDLAGAERLARTLGGLPLAAEQAASYLRPRAGVSFDDYAADIARLIRRPRPSGSTGDYPDTVYASFVKSLETLNGLGGGDVALDILRLCAFLSPDGVDLDLLIIGSGHMGLPPHVATALIDKSTREDALAALISLSLLKREDGPAGTMLIFHRLLLEVVRDWMGGEARALWGDAAAKLVSSAFPYNSDDDPSQWALCARLMSHIPSLQTHAPRSGALNRALFRLLNQAGLYLAARGDRAGALALTEQAMALGRVVEIENPLRFAIVLSNLGRRYTDLDRLDDAESAFREVLGIQEQRLKSDDPALAITLSNLAHVLWNRDDFAAAEPLFLRAAKTMKAARGAESAEYAVTASNLGALYGQWANEPGQETRRTQEKKYKAKALEIYLGARGPRHPETAMSRNNLAVMKAAMGDWVDAQTDLKCALAIMLSLDLSQHPNTINIARDLAYCWENCGQVDKATRLRSGDISDLLPVIAQVEEEHRAWVLKDPSNRRFSPQPPAGYEAPRFSE
jgi:tetratricopeptide (TPR) repeat protein